MKIDLLFLLMISRAIKGVVLNNFLLNIERKEVTTCLGCSRKL